MAAKRARQVALLSIHPQHATSIMQGTKKVELRRSRFARPVTHVVVYATAPTSRVVGWFDVVAIDEGTPTSLWSRHGSHAGVTRRQFRSYFSGAKLGYALRVGTPVRLAAPVRLDELGSDVTAPQSYRYLDAQVIDDLAASATG